MGVTIHALPGYLINFGETEDSNTNEQTMAGYCQEIVIPEENTFSQYNIPYIDGQKNIFNGKATKNIQINMKIAKGDRSLAITEFNNTSNYCANAQKPSKLRINTNDSYAQYRFVWAYFKDISKKDSVGGVEGLMDYTMNFICEPFFYQDKYNVSDQYSDNEYFKAYLNIDDDKIIHVTNATHSITLNPGGTARTSYMIFKITPNTSLNELTITNGTNGSSMTLDGPFTASTPIYIDVRNFNVYRGTEKLFDRFYYTGNAEFFYLNGGASNIITFTHTTGNGVTSNDYYFEIGYRTAFLFNE